MSIIVRRTLRSCASASCRLRRSPLTLELGQSGTASGPIFLGTFTCLVRTHGKPVTANGPRTEAPGGSRGRAAGLQPRITRLIAQSSTRLEPGDFSGFFQLELVEGGLEPGALRGGAHEADLGFHV